MSDLNPMCETSLNILIVDDERNIRKTLSYCLEADGHEVTSVSNGKDAVSELKDVFFDLVFLDLKLGSEDGMELVSPILASSPWTKVIVITAHASIESTVKAISLGATDYVAKPFTPAQIKLVTGKIIRIRNLEREILALRESINPSESQERFFSKSPSMQRIIETAKKVAESDAIILLCGESGTGKSMLAKAIHKWSKRAENPMITVACPAVPQELLESELFGVSKGAFTGAVRDAPGRISACENGTLFLDEIGDLPGSMQAKLLRFIQDKEYERLGESIVRKANVRIIAATNTDLENLVTTGKFREDLYYRLNVINITVPPLRERTKDILDLAREFLVFFCQANHKSIIGFTREVEEHLCNYSWPGNVRELRNTIERAVILGNTEKITVDDIPQLSTVTQTTAIGDPVKLSFIEELHIRKIIARTSSLQEAASVLGIDLATLWRKRKAFGI